MSLAVTLADIAAALGTDKGTVSVRASQGGWSYTETPVRGGRKRLYAVADLPAPVQDALRRQMLAPAPVPVDPDAGDRLPAVAEPAPALTEKDLAGWQRDAMTARLVLVREAERVSVAGGLLAAYRSLAVGVARGDLRPELMAAAQAANVRPRDGQPLLSASTLRRWRDVFEAAGRKPIALAPLPATPADPLPPAWMADFFEFFALPSKPSVTRAAADCRAKRPDVRLPPIRTIQRHIEALPALERMKGRLGPRELRSMKAFVRRDVSMLWPTAVYVTDGYTHHAFVQHPITGKPFRPEVTSTIDVVTRRLVGWSVGLAETTWGTIDALRHAFTTCGIPDIWYVDRGKGFNSDVLADDLTGLLARFDVTKHNSLPYRSQARGVIERFHREIIEEARLLPAYAGQDMDPEARKLVDRRIDADLAAAGQSDLLQTWPEFVGWMEKLIATYNARPHSGLPKFVDAAGKRRPHSPDEAWRFWEARGWEADRISQADADWLFRPQEKRVSRRGEVQLFTNVYFALDLEDWHEREILVGYDIHDASRVWCSTLDGRFICEAKYFGNSIAYFPRDYASQLHEKRVGNRLRRNDKRRAAIETERVPPTLEIAAETPTPVIRSDRPAPSLQVVPPEPVAAAAPPATPAPSPDGERPARFGSDVEMVVWLARHPDAITGHDARFLIDQLRRPNFRLRIEFEGIDPEALTDTAKAFLMKETAS